MEAACSYIEKVVNDELAKRKRYPLEYGGSNGTDGNRYTWRANVAASNCYEGAKESVGFHSDQLTYLGPYPTIASLSLGKCHLHDSKLSRTLNLTTQRQELRAYLDLEKWCPRLKLSPDTLGPSIFHFLTIPFVFILHISCRMFNTTEM